MPRLQPGWTRKDIEQLPIFFFLLVKMLNVLYILEALRHNYIMPGLLPGWTRKDIEQLPNCFLRLRVEILNVLYILEALRHNNIMPGLLPGWTRKDIEQLPNFYSAAGRNTERVIYPRSAQTQLVCINWQFFESFDNFYKVHPLLKSPFSWYAQWWLSNSFSV